MCRLRWFFPFSWSRGILYGGFGRLSNDPDLPVAFVLLCDVVASVPWDVLLAPFCCPYF
jgi:hypothetical protein